MAKRKTKTDTATPGTPPPPPGIATGVDVPVESRGEGLVVVASEPPPAESKSVAVVESPSTTVTTGGVSIEVPFLVLGGNLIRRVDARLSREQAETWRAIYRGLEQREATLKNGRMVANITDAIRYVGENFTVPA